ncbi:MAG: hypothetical protein M9938_00465 [Solirubrobacterales bacterium]|nr:hypothetical protein [Solirubrobacterales bacterium]
MRLDDQLLREAKEAAAREGTTLTALITDSLRERISRTDRTSSPTVTRLPSCPGNGLRGGLDPELINDNAALADLMDGLD